MIDFDFAILYWIQDNLVNDVLTPFFRIITHAGDSGMIWIVICLGLMIPKKTRWIGITAGISLALVAILNNFVIKPIAARPRPFTYTDISLLISAPHGYSFPSGHTSSSFAAAAAIFLGSKKLGIPALILAILIGFSRMYFFVHFPSDVFFGAAEGILVALLIVKLGDQARKKLPSTLGKL